MQANASERTHHVHTPSQQGRHCRSREFTLHLACIISRRILDVVLFSHYSRVNGHSLLRLKCRTFQKPQKQLVRKGRSEQATPWLLLVWALTRDHTCNLRLWGQRSYPLRCRQGHLCLSGVMQNTPFGPC